MISAVLFYMETSLIHCHYVAFNELGMQCLYFPMLGGYWT